MSIHIAAKFRRQALSIMTVSDMIDRSSNTFVKACQIGFRNTVEIALAATE